MERSVKITQARKGNRSGFTLLEILVATSLLSVLLVGFSSVFLTANQWLKPSGSNRNVAYFLAGAHLEDLYKEVNSNDWSASDIVEPPVVPLSVPLYASGLNAGTPEPGQTRTHPSNHNFYESGTQASMTSGVSPIVLDGVNYTVTYKATGIDTNSDGVEDYRKVDTIVSWTP